MLPYSIVKTTLVFIFIHHVHSLDQPPRVTRPPTIIPGLDTDVIYFDPSQKYKPELPCSAIGNDPKTFEWTKNGKLMKIDKYKFEWTKNGQILDFADRKYISNSTNKPRIVRMDKHTGRIQLTELRDDDAGVYQCVTKNTFGTSLSQKIRLVESTTRAFTNPQQERKYRVLAANSLKLPCNPPENDPPGIVHWLKYEDGGEGTKRVILDSRIAQDGEGNLYFANVQKSDENDNQKYVCQAELPKKGVFITGAFSKISVDDDQPGAQFPVELAYQSQSEVIALKGRYITFQCIFTGNPTPSISWVRKTGGKIDKSRMFLESTRFRIKKVQYQDEGIYECIGTNSVSSARGIRRTFNLKVLSKPEWSAKPQKVDAGEEEQAVFECSGEGQPPPKVQWFINGEPIESLSSNPRRILSDGQLRFTDLTRDDAQVVQCNVSNTYGSLWADVALSILAFQPEIKASFQQIKVSEGGIVTLPCEIEGKPKPLIFWKRGNQKIEGPRFRQSPTGNLTILNSTMSDEGNWTCFAENKYGKLNSTGLLIVRIQTKIDMPPLPPRQRIRFGSATTFKCAASTDPDEMGNLEISWLKDGEPVDFNNPRIIKNGNEIIINGSTSEDTGKYTCVASNKLDSDTASAQLEVTAPPDPPTDVSFSSCLSRSAIVSWKPGFDNFSPITKFYVEYNHSYAPDIWTKAAVVSDTTKTEASVKLSPHANYTFRVIAENNFGKSKPSEKSIAMCDTNPARPDKNPGNLRTDRSRPGWLIIKWDEMKPIEHNGDDFRYNLTIRKDGMINRTTISDWQETTKEIYIGKIYEPYEMHIEAWNEKGKSGDTAVIHIGYTGEGELLSSPSEFEIVPGVNVTDKVAVFQWNPINTRPDMVQGEFKGYKIRFWKLGQRNTTQKSVEVSRQPETDSRIQRDVLKETATVQTLYPNSMIMADVVAMNTFFESEPSNVVTFETPEGVPGRVKKARVVTRGAHHFLIEWEEPEEPNGNLTGYEIGYRKVDGFDLGEVMETTKYDDPDRSRAFLGNLDANQEYNIYIWAKTSKGVGDEYYFDAKTANRGPLIVPEMTIEVVGEDFVNVSWNVNPMEDAPAGAYHYVQFRELGKGEWEVSEDEKINNWINVSGLVPNTQYEISVVAANDLVQSPSQIRKILTKGEAMQSATETNLAQTPWFIVMMVLIAVLILFLIIICFIKRSRGEKYNVQEREKLRGNDIENPDKDLFNEYPKSSETDPLAAGSPDSFDNEGDKLPGGSETDSMAEYGDVDPSKFNEDGSFIGQYGSQKPDEKGNQPSAMSTFV